MEEAYNELREYQKVGVQFLVERDFALLSDEMGLGKTVQTAVAIELLLAAKKCEKILILCPSSLTLNWERELKLWAPGASVRRVVGDAQDRKAHYWLPFKVWIASYEQIRMDIDFLYKSCDYDLVILDETQRIKNIDSNLSVSCRQIKRKKAWALTGTPVENNIDDLYSIFAFLSPRLVIKGEPLNTVHEQIAPFFLRRTKKQVLDDLPPIIEQDLLLELSPAQETSYVNAVNDTYEEFRSASGDLPIANLFSKLVKLKQICNFDPITGASSKLDALQLYLEKIQDNRLKTLIFSQYVETLKWLSTHIDLPFDLFHGGISSSERDTIIQQFEASEGPRILLISLKAGGVGLNLNSASLVILYDMWWNPAVEKQAIQRAHRFGKKEALQVVRFVVQDTIEERIKDILTDKNILFENIVENAKGAMEGKFTKSQLLNLIGIN